jgi:murein DD-endopeptidase MepM/ murein hydrolase activator NlpD
VRILGVAGLALATGIIAATAQEMKGPRISPIQAAWDEVAAELNTIDALGSGRRSAGPAEHAQELAASDLMLDLNRATGQRFANIAASPVPVLLPFDTAAFLSERTAAATGAAAASADATAGNYLFGFAGVPFFYAGPGGYDAVILARAQEMRELGIHFSEPIHIHVGGSALVYELDEPVGMIGWPVHGLDEMPGIRRLYLENSVRYTFIRYGVPYVVAIDCFEGRARFRKISCRDADKVAIRLIKALRIVGGAPQPPLPVTAADTIDRPAERSAVFTYHSPGDLIPGTGFRRKGGVADYTVYSKIRFPIAGAPAFANSQSFMNWGNCEATGRTGLGSRGGVAAYRCRVSGQTLVADESAADNYSYPWRDNFCETRHFAVGQCPAGLGHQGQDIRPASCKQRIEGANRCEPYLHDVVAVRDGAVLRAPGRAALYLVVDAPNERVRFRYLHMSPRQLDADGMVSGRSVREGEVIGKVGNFDRRERGTSYHLHFDMQVPTKYGWVYVNPYMTLVAAYERLIRGRGEEIKQDGSEEVATAVPAPQAPAMLAAKPTETAVDLSPAATIDSGVRRDAAVEQLSPVTARMSGAAGDGRDLEPAGAGTEQQIGVRSVGGRVSRPGKRAWHIRRHLHAGDGQHQTRHGGVRTQPLATGIQRAALAIPQSPRLRLAHHHRQGKGEGICLAFCSHREGLRRRSLHYPRPVGH